MAARIALLLGVIAVGTFLVEANAGSREFSILGYAPQDIQSDEALAALYNRWCSQYPSGCSSWMSNDVSEKQKRIEIFRDNLRYIDEHNRAGHSYWLGLNQFSDLTNDEFRQRFLGLRANFTLQEPSSSEHASVNNDDDLPSSVDWREKGAVTTPKDQGSCGGCWAFSTTGAIEGINKIVTGELISLSEQELVDCDTLMDNGCNGGLMSYAFDFVTKNGGLDTEEDYPYDAHQHKCDLSKRSKKVVSIDGYKSIESGDENAMLRVVARQPVSVAIEGGGRGFQHYAGGVFTGPCGEDVNHGVLIVGYGSDGDVPYWIVKNSWGPRWGEAGFVKMKRSPDSRKSKGLCSINTLASYPIKKGGDTPSAPPSPSPTPTQCNSHQRCPSGTTCCCRFQVKSMCITWGCCNIESAVCCSDHRHCCPLDHPVCDTSKGLCLKESGSVFGVRFQESILASTL